jgi:hypothetical protein
LNIKTINHAERGLAGAGTLIGPPPNVLFSRVVEFLKTHLSRFAESVLNTSIVNENGLNSRLSRFITNAADQEFFFAQREAMEDEARGNSPAADIGIFLKVDDMEIDPPLITVFEGKRLTKILGAKRRLEYVIGHEMKGKHIPCGGIERFKFALHGVKLTHAGMIGYLQDGTPAGWREKINAWISDLCCRPFAPAWSELEHLTPEITKGAVTECSSVVDRGTGRIHLVHLWINLGN